MRHLDRMAAAARALCGNHADADDLVQDVMLSLIQRPRRLKRGSELAYLMTMLRNAQVDRYRAAARRQTSSLDEAELEGREVLEAVHSLDSPFRETVVAVDVLGLSYKEAANALDVPVGTVMSRLARGRERVVAMLSPLPEVARG
jgi:RNA polymerase sigma-70 factor (ECF subfamily)